MLFKFGWLSALVVSIVMSVPASAGVPVGGISYLDIDFNDRAPGDSLGVGGPLAGEPVGNQGLSGVIVERTSGENFLSVDDNSGNNFGKALLWDFLNGAEITEGTVQVSFRFTPLALDEYNFGIRESGGSAKKFVDVNFNANGSLTMTDENGVITEANDSTYVADTELFVVIDFDMDAGTSQMRINGTTIFSGRAHGVTDRGVGRVITGYGFPNNANPFELDDLRVNGNVPLPLVLDANFDDKTLGDVIKTGGAQNGEPVTISNGFQTTITELTVGNPALLIQNSTTGTARAMRWEFLDGLEIQSGVVGLDVDLKFAVRDAYQVLVRESGTSANSFSTLRFSEAGSISLTDANGAASLPSFSYNAGQLYRLRMTYDMNAGTYSVLLDDTELVVDRAHGVSTGRGVGSVLFAVQNSASSAAEFLIDELQVGASDAPYIPSQLNFLVEPTAGVINQPLVPSLEIGVVNVYDDAIQDGILVDVGIETGPGGATISGEIEPTVGGIARFDSLQLDMPWVYRLQARAARATAISEVDISVMPPPNEVFEDGFEGEFEQVILPN